MTDKPEPSVLDYVKSLLIPGRERVKIPPPEEDIEAITSLEPVERDFSGDVELPETLAIAEEKLPFEPLPWIALLALLAALAAQFSLEPRPGRDWVIGAVFYAAAAGAVIFALVRRQMELAEANEAQPGNVSLTVDGAMLGISLGLAAVSFLFFGNGQFTTVNVIVWLSSIGFFIYSVRSPGSTFENPVKRLWQGIQSELSIKISPWNLVWLAALAIGIYFRVTLFNQVPSEMVSDHAEKLYDISDILNGQSPVFFVRNTGREAFQFYWTVLIINVFGTGISFFSLKLGTVLLGIFTLPFFYLIGKELGNKKVGLFAMFFAGIAYWPNVISRAALRFTLYPAFLAPTLYFFLRGMTSQKRRYFVLSGIFLGLGLHGYTPFRVVPILLVVAVVLYLFHNRSNRAVKHAMVGLVLITIAAILVALPLLRYSIDHPDQVLYRTMTRIGNVEQAIAGSPGSIFLQNLWRAMTMFAWDDGEVWVHSVPHRPALDVVTAVLYHLGFVAILYRYIRKRKWTDLLILLSIPILMLPSILSLAFPSENPSLNRTSGAIIPVFILVGFAMDGMYSAVRKAMGKSGPLLAGGLTALMLFVSASQNYDLVFNQYRTNFDSASWNSTQIGQVMADFIDTWGTPDSAYVIGYPHWVDTRLVGINAGTPDRDYGISIEQIPETQVQVSPKLFAINPNDTPALETLMENYPNGVMRLMPSTIQGREFYIFFVP